MPDDREIARGRRLLRELLPWARAELAKGEFTAEAESALARSAVTYITEQNLDAVMIYPAPRGGWHGDVVLKNIPPGVPNSFGTQVEHPCATRAGAEETAKRVLVTLLHLAAKNAQTKPADPVFMLHGWTFKLLPDLLPTALAIMPEFATGYGSPLQAMARVEAKLDQLCPEGFDGNAFNKWPHEKKAELMATLHIAALSGLFVYPMRRDGKPEDPSNA